MAADYRLSYSKINRYGYIIKKSDLGYKKINQIKDELTVEPIKPKSYARLSKNSKFEIYREDEEYISVPKYYGIEKFGPPSINILETKKYEKINIMYKSLLRPNQKIIVDKVLNGFEKERGGLLIAGCGSGKTNMAIYIASVIGLKTLVIAHQKFLITQFTDRAKSITDIQSIGLICGKKCDVNHQIVVGTIQTLIKKKSSDDIFKKFGLVIIDEVHHMAARNYSKFFKKFSTKYMLGISAERSRLDGMYKIINWYMGPILHFEEQKPNEMVLVKRINFRTHNKERTKTIINKFIGEPDRSKMITNLTKIKSRNRLIVNIIEELFDSGKNILFLTGRISHVNIIYELLEKNEYTKGHSGKYIGGMTENELEISSTKQIIIGTFHIAQEGLDIPGLNAVILSTPLSTIKQPVGRILRKEIYEEHPIVIDIVDEDVNIFVNQSKKRMQYYKQQLFNIQDFYFSSQDKPNYKLWSDNLYIKEMLSKTATPKTSNKKTIITTNVNVEDIECLSDGD